MTSKFSYILYIAKSINNINSTFALVSCNILNMPSFLFNDFKNFPSIENADEDGFLAIGGNLSPETLLKAYSSGIFPWYNEDEPICWFSPPERCVIFPEKIKVSKSMHQLIRKNVFSISKNKAFDQVIENCAHVKRKNQDGTWISAEMQMAYKKMHVLGYASSIEVWQDNKIVGGLYGIEMGNVFCGESMFSLVPNASKLAFIHLCNHYQYRLIDCQVENPHLLSLGAEIIPRDTFINLLNKYLKQ